jgi:hypothetical protein
MGEHPTSIDLKTMVRTPMELEEYYHKNLINMIYLKMLGISQMWMMIINKEMFFQLDINMALKIKQNSKIRRCNPETENIQ